MILVIDNYDSFVHNLARYVREAQRAVRVVRNDAISVAECLALAPAGVILSPGPKSPREAGLCLDLLGALPSTIPVLGVCLGHQCLAEAFGGRTLRASAPLHGEASQIHHGGEGIFAGIASPTLAGRYHSLIAEPPQKASPFRQTAWTEDGMLMGLSHLDRPWHGVQFHPESLLTVAGRQMVENFLDLA